MANIYWVSNTGQPASEDDVLIQNLEDNGNVVTVGLDADPVPPNIGDFDLVFISAATGGSSAPGGTWLSTPIPVMCYQPYSLDEMEESASHSDMSGENTVTIVDAAHPIAGGLPAGPVVIVTTGSTFSSESNQGPDLKVVATASDGSPMISYYDTGDEGNDGFIFTAPRAYFAVRADAQPNANDNWFAIQNGMVDWIMGPPPPTTNLNVYDGADFVLAIPSVWDGANWVPVQAKTWDGSQWIG